MAGDRHLPGGVFAVNKPSEISSAQVIRNVQVVFDKSEFFAELLEDQKNEAKGKSKKRRALSSHVKMGHGGTLDPMATGVLILGIGRGTKQLQTFLECTKSYETVVLFGAATDSYDRLGKVIGRKSFDHITKEKVERALQTFRGKIMQKPPIFSALRQDGKRLYEYAREGKELPREIQARPVEVHELELVEWLDGDSHPYELPRVMAEHDETKAAQAVLQLEPDQDNLEAANRETSVNITRVKREFEASEDQGDNEQPDEKKTKIAPAEVEENATKAIPPEPHISNPKYPKPPAARIRMVVTSGFYVRSFCHDLGAALGSLAIMSELIRTRQGDFELKKNVMEYQELEGGDEKVWANTLKSMLDDWNVD